MNVSLLPRKVFAALCASLLALTSLPAHAQAPQPPAAPAPEPVPIPPKARPVSLPPNTFNIALLGVDKRPDRGFMNTDVIIIASVNPDVPAVTMLSIPRDTPAYIPGVGVQKINTAYAAGGPDLFKETILYNFGLKIDNYAMVNFAGVVHAVEALGGIDVIATCPIQHTFPRDPYYMGGLVTSRDWVDTFTGEVWPAGTRIPLTSIDIPSPGVYSLNGLEALAFARARKGIPGGDVDRGRREQRVLRAMLAKARQVGSLNKLTDLYNAVKDDVESDMTLETILRYALMADKIGDAVIRSRYLVGYDANGAALPDAPNPKLNRQAYIEQALNVALNQRINDGIPVEVINGTGDAGFALAAADRLKELGFVITNIKPADQPYKSSVIIDHTTTPKGSPLPLILRTFNLKAANVQADPQPEGPRFSIIVGPDFNTCYYASSLRRAGSDPIAAGLTEDVETPLEQSVIVTDSAKIETAMSQPITETNIIISATALLTTTPAVVVAGAAPDTPLVPTAALTPTFFVPTGDLINVRSSPTTRARLLGRLRGPAEGDILGRSIDGKWLQFFFPRANRVAWINSDVVTMRGYFENEPAVVEAPVAAEPPRVTIPRGDVVNIRQGPGTDFDVLGRMRSRQTAAIIGKNADGSWWQIRFGDAAAWVNSGVVQAIGDIAGVPIVQ
jgi:anionic cell wall polymer biosynthesis LytR-Cps2A-Psr (LCP) family protein